MYEFRLLGPLEALIEGNSVNLAAAKPRALLALLLLHRNRVVPTETLIDELWGDEPPARATKTLQVYVSQLRKELGPDRLVTRAPGYELRIGEDELDVDRFEKLAAEARERLAAGDAAGAVEGMRRALDLWRGPALLEFREPFAERASARLEDLRLAAVEDLLSAALEAGEAAGIVPELEELVASHPLRERPRELLMLALYRAGRQADALELFRRTRELFVSELGIEPSASLRELEQAMLRQDTALLETPRAKRAARMPPDAARPRRWRAPWTLVAAAALRRCRNRHGSPHSRRWHQQPANHSGSRPAGAIVRVQARELSHSVARRPRAGHARDSGRLRLQPAAGRRGRATGSGSTEPAEPAPAGGRSASA